MNKIDDAWAEGIHLSDEQVAEVRRRLADTGEATLTPSEFRARLLES
jgi:hypothetical protein